jgi:hypothetical protein
MIGTMSQPERRAAHSPQYLARLPIRAANKQARGVTWLVRFGIRDGRLCQWSQRTCGQSSAMPQLAATPAGWRGFAQRNAELAAALVERF